MNMWNVFRKRNFSVSCDSCSSVHKTKVNAMSYILKILANHCQEMAMTKCLVQSMNVVAFGIATFLVWTFELELFGASLECNEAYSCAYDITSAGAENILCDGSHSCYGSTLLESSLDIYCQGSYACANSLTIQQTGSSDYLGCYGLFSCGNVNFTYGSSVNSRMQCYGDQSCRNTTFRRFNKVDGWA